MVTNVVTINKGNTTNATNTISYEESGVEETKINVSLQEAKLEKDLNDTNPKTTFDSLPKQPKL